jgi:LmbE family N-acetylglucosaminyl deacetylase
MDSLDRLDVVKKIEALVESVNPHIVYTHHRGDVNVDHTVLHDAVMTACRPLPGSRVEEIYCFEVLSSSEWPFAYSRVPFVANHFEYLDPVCVQKKLSSMSAYKDEIREFPHPRSTEALAAQMKLRGSQCGHPAAEAFALARSIKR